MRSAWQGCQYQSLRICKLFFFVSFSGNKQHIRKCITCCFIPDVCVQGGRQLIRIFQGIAYFSYVRRHLFKDTRFAERRRNHVFAGRYVCHGDGDEGQESNNNQLKLHSLELNKSSEINLIELEKQIWGSSVGFGSKCRDCIPTISKHILQYVIILLYSSSVDRAQQSI